MIDYKAPLRDIQFVLNDILDLERHYSALPDGESVSPDLVDSILEEFARFAENELAPLNRVGDEQGTRLVDGQVVTADGFKHAYNKYVEAGWQAMSMDPEYGGQGLPLSLSHVLMEMKCSANIAWEVFNMASHGAMKTLAMYGTEEQKDVHLRKLVEGAWTGTMCLTEPHCGSDLGLLRTSADPRPDGSYAITGTKIFISGGDHDFTDNIVHIVLARIKGAPEGTQGISLFIVPKVLCDEQGNLLERNSLSCGSLEHKMGMHGNPTCEMVFDNASGYLLGPVNKGLMAMFTFMNSARIGAAIQGLGHVELGFQKSLDYAKNRLQMRSRSGIKYPDQPADPIIVHPDVRRMLMTQKALSEGLRMFNYYLALQLDMIHAHPDESEQRRAQSRLDLLTPIAKAFSTEMGLEAASHALQCFGGHGYIRETGVEQNLRDARIGTIWEGTTAIQANDLLDRKVLGSKGALLHEFIDEIESFCATAVVDETTGPLIATLKASAGEWRKITSDIASRAEVNADELGAAAVNYLMYSGYICLAYFWAQAAVTSRRKLVEENPESGFYASKVTVAAFFYESLLTRNHSLKAAIDAGCASIMQLASENF